VAVNSCNNGIIAVDKTIPDSIVWIQEAAPANLIYNIIPFGNYVLYTLATPGSGGAFARIEDATAPALPPHQCCWQMGLRDRAVNVVSNQQTVLRAVLVQNVSSGANGAVMKAFSSPTGSPVTLGTVSDPTNRLQGFPFFPPWTISTNEAMIGFARLSANTLLCVSDDTCNNQPFFVDTTVPNSLTQIQTAPASWREPSD
jgi:hypothetical protein